MKFSKGFIDGYENSGYNVDDVRWGDEDYYNSEWEKGVKARSIHLQIVFGLNSFDEELKIENFAKVNQKALYFLNSLESV